MKCKNICDLPAAAGLNSSDGILIMQNGKAVFMTLEQFNSYSAANPGIILDTTLKEVGMAADAAAVGAAFTALKNSYTQLIRGVHYGTEDEIPANLPEGGLFYKVVG